MKYKAGLILLIAVLILVASGLGVSIIYSDYLYNPHGVLSVLQIGIANDTGYIDSTISPKEKQFLIDLDQWAQDHHATILFKDGLTAGGGYCSYSDWEQHNLQITRIGDNPNGVYVLNSNCILEPYESDGVFLPGSAGLEVAGYYGESHLPLTIKGIDFLYPITAASTTSGMYFTDTQDLDVLIRFFEDNGYELLSKRESSAVTFMELIQTMLSDGPRAIATMAAMAGLLFCFVYVILILYRDMTKTLKIHHLFGMSLRTLAVTIVLISAAMLLSAILLVRVLLVNGLTYLGRDDLRNILCFTFGLHSIVIIVVNGIGCQRLFRRIC